MALNRRHWHCLVASNNGRIMYRKSVRLTAAERANDLPEGSKQVTRRWFANRQAAHQLGKRLGRAYVVVACDDEHCTDAPAL